MIIMTRKFLEGSHAIAEAVKMAKPSVIAAYPITPQTHIVEKLAEMVANGELDAEYLNVESEHSAMAACIGAQATGVRTYTATSSQGLAYMWELLYTASGMRLPVVMTVVNRALSAPLNIWNDWSDSMGCRDSGWIQLYCENAQEAFDTTLQAYRISEKSLLPTMVCIDGFYVSHTFEPVEINENASSFVGEYKIPEIDSMKIELNTKNPVTQGAYALPQHYQDFKEKQQDAMELSKAIITKANDEFKQEFGRAYGNGLLETYNTERAKHVIITMGSIVGTIRHVIDSKKIRDVGIIKIKSFRPFPEKELNIINEFKSATVLEKDISIGNCGALFTEIKALSEIPISNFVGGLGGRDITPASIEKIFSILRKKDEKFHWI